MGLSTYEFRADATLYVTQADRAHNATESGVNGTFTWPGDTLVLDEGTAGGLFDSYEGDLASLVTIAVGDVNCTDVVASSSSLSCTLDPEAAPAGEGAAIAVFATARFGHGIVEGARAVDVRPVVTAVSASRGSLRGGTDLVVDGYGFREGAAVWVDGVAACSDVAVLSASRLACVTEAVATPAKRGVFAGAVRVSSAGVASACGGSCGYVFDGNDTAHTPWVDAARVEGGAVTLRGAGFAASGNVVTVGGAACAVASENETAIACALPDVAAGVREIAVDVPGKGFAAGYGLWWREPLVVDAVSSLDGSLYGGQTFTMRGSGFPTCVKASEPAPKSVCAADRGCAFADAEALFELVDGSRFAVDVLESTYATLTAATTLRDASSPDYAADAGSFAVTVGGAAGALALDGDNALSPDDGAWLEAFDGSASTSWDVAGTSGDAWLGGTTWAVYDCGEPTVVTAYAANREVADFCDAWTFSGSEDGSTWDALDERASDCDGGDDAFDVDEPGLYRYYRWTFDVSTLGDSLDAAYSIKELGLSYGYAAGDDDGAFHAVRAYGRDGATTPEVEAVTARGDRIRVEGAGFAGDVVVYVGGLPCLPYAATESPTALPTATTPPTYGTPQPSLAPTYSTWLPSAAPTMTSSPTYGTPAPSTAPTYETEGPTYATAPPTYATGAPSSEATSPPSIEATGAPSLAPSPVPTFLRFECVAPNVSAGAYPVVVFSREGLAGPAAPLLYERPLALANFSADSPTRGSLGGGTVLTLRGSGFAEAAADNLVTIAGAPCAVFSSFGVAENVSAISCATGALEDNVTALASARVAVRTRFRSNERVTIHAGDSDGSNSGGLSFVYATNDVGCGFRNELWYESWQGVLFAFYDAKARAFEASLFQSDLSVAQSEEAAAFIESYERRDDLVLLVVTSRWFRMSEEHTLRDAVKRCGGSDALFKLAASSWGWVYGDYVLIGQCGKGAGWSASKGLEGSSEEGVTIDVDLDAFFSIPNGEATMLQNFTYDPKLSPTLTALSRFNGTTAGGTTLEINMTGIETCVDRCTVPGPNLAPRAGIAKGLATTGNVSVTLGGVTCAVKYSEIGSYRDQHLCDWDGVDCSNLGVGEPASVGA